MAKNIKRSSLTISAVILAGGYGTRLLKNGLTIPKGLIQTRDKTIVGRLMGDLEEAEAIEEIILITNAKFYPHYSSWLASRNASKPVLLLNDKSTHPDNRKGALGDLYLTLEKRNLWKKNILVFPSDTLYGFPFSSFIDFIAIDPFVIASVVRDTENPLLIKNRLGCCEVNNSMVVGFEEKPKYPKSTFASVPFYYFPAEKVEVLKQYKKAGNNMDAPGQILAWAAIKGISIRAFISRDYTLDVGTPEDLSKARDF